MFLFRRPPHACLHFRHELLSPNPFLYYYVNITSVASHPRGFWAVSGCPALLWLIPNAFLILTNTRHAVLPAPPWCALSSLGGLGKQQVLRSAGRQGAVRATNPVNMSLRFMAVDRFSGFFILRFCQCVWVGQGTVDAVLFSRQRI